MNIRDVITGGPYMRFPWMNRCLKLRHAAMVRHLMEFYHVGAREADAGMAGRPV
jgi:hypothetical protein